MEYLFLPIGKAHTLELHLRGLADLRDGVPAIIRQLRLVKDLLDPVHAAVHDGQPGGLGIQGLDGAEQVKDKEHDAHQIGNAHEPGALQRQGNGRDSRSPQAVGKVQPQLPGGVVLLKLKTGVAAPLKVIGQFPGLFSQQIVGLDDPDAFHEVQHRLGAGNGLVIPAQPYGLDGLQLAVLVAHQLGHGGLVDPGIVAEEGDGLLLAVIGFAHPWPLRPGVIFRPLIGGLGHHLQLGHAGAAVADAGAHAVVAGVAAAHDDHVLTLGGGVGAVGQIGIQQGTGGLLQKVHREPHPVQLPAGNGQIPGLGGAAAQHHRVKVPPQLLRAEVLAHIHAGAEGDALGGHLVQPPLDHRLLQLHIGNAVYQKASGPVFPLQHGNAVAPAVELVGAGQTGGAGAHHRHLLAGAGPGRPGGHESPVPGVLNDAQLVVLDGDRVPVEAAGAGRLAQGGTHPAGKLREVVGL